MWDMRPRRAETSSTAARSWARAWRSLWLSPAFWKPWLELAAGRGIRFGRALVGEALEDPDLESGRGGASFRVRHAHGDRLRHGRPRLHLGIGAEEDLGVLRLGGNPDVLRIAGPSVDEAPVEVGRLQGQR